MLFKPTKSTKNPFRPTGEEAMSYFVGAEAMNAPQFEGEDAGFAINGGKGWKSVRPCFRVRVGVRVRVRGRGRGRPASRAAAPSAGG